MEMRSGTVEGVVPAMVTPMHEDGAVDPETALQLLGILQASGVSAVMVMGTTGEGALLDEQERLRLLDAIGTRHWTLPVIAHVGHPSTYHTVRLAVRAVERGCSAVSAVTPYYYSYDQNALAEHFTAVARAIRPAGLYLYTIPAHTHNPVEPDLLADLLARADNIVGIKDSTGEARLLSAYAQVCRAAGAAVLSGNDRLFLHGLTLGTSGAVTSAAGVYPEAYRAVWDAWQDGEHNAAVQAQLHIDALCTIFRDGAQLSLYKAALGLRGLAVGPVRAPLRPALAADIRRLEREIGALGLGGPLPGPPAPRVQA